MKLSKCLLFSTVLLLTGCFGSPDPYINYTHGFINEWRNYQYCDYDGTVLDESPVLLWLYGSAKYRSFDYQGETPTRPMEDGKYYVFSGWNTSNLEFIPEDTHPNDVTNKHIQTNIRVYAQYDVYEIEDIFEMEKLEDGSYAVSNKVDVFTDFTIENKYGNKTVSALMTGAYANDKKIENVVIKDGIKTIGSSAFERCSSLKNISIPNSVENIGGFAFHDCKSLIEVSLPNKITDIYRSTFNSAEKLEKVKINSDIQTIHDYAFYNCSSLKEINFPESLETIKSYAFKNCVNLESIKFNSINWLDFFPESFANAEKLKELDLSQCDRVNMYKGAFVNCTSLETIKFPQKPLYFDDEVFKGCTSLRRVIIPDHIINIGENMFNGCSSNLEVYLENSDVDYNYEPLQKGFDGKIFLYSETEPTEYGNYWYYDNNGDPVKW